MHGTTRLLSSIASLLALACSPSEPTTRPTGSPAPVTPTAPPATPSPMIPTKPSPPLPVLAQFREASNAFPQALLSGTVIELDGCIRVRAGADPRGHLIVWQPDHQIRRNGERIEIVDGSGKVVARVGDPIQLGGGEIPEATLAAALKAPLPPACTGPYWMAAPK